MKVPSISSIDVARARLKPLEPRLERRSGSFVVLETPFLISDESTYVLKVLK